MPGKSIAHPRLGRGLGMQRAEVELGRLDAVRRLEIGRRFGRLGHFRGLRFLALRLAPEMAAAPQPPIRPGALPGVLALEADILPLGPFAVAQHQRQARGEDDHPARPGQRPDQRRQRDQEESHADQRLAHRRLLRLPGPPMLHARRCGVAVLAAQDGVPTITSLRYVAAGDTLIDMNPKKSEGLYRRLSGLIATMPNFEHERYDGPLSDETHRWIARLIAAVTD